MKAILDSAEHHAFIRSVLRATAPGDSHVCDHP